MDDFFFGEPALQPERQHHLLRLRRPEARGLADRGGQVRRAERHARPAASFAAAKAVQRFARAGWLNREAANGPTSQVRQAASAQPGSPPACRVRVLRQAEVQVTEYCPGTQSVVVTVSTWDNWSLLPKISLGHEGGETKSNIGFAEDNLLGTGNQLQAEYFNDSERDGYQLRFLSPNIGGSYWQTAVQYADNSDGESYQFRLNKPFYRISSEWAFNFEFSKDIKDVSEYELGDEYNEFQSNRDYAEVSGGWKISQHGTQVQHLNAGITLDDHQFASNENSTRPAPANRDLSQIWIGWDWFQSDYQKMYNFFQFKKVEDINFGWQASARLGRLNKGLGADSTGWNFQATLAKNWPLTEVSWLTYRSEYQQLEGKNFQSP